jgi:hypothetical protein
MEKKYVTLQQIKTHYHDEKDSISGHRRHDGRKQRKRSA